MRTKKRRATRLAKLRKLTTDRQAERFIDTAELTRFDLSVLKPMQFELAPRKARINGR